MSILRVQRTKGYTTIPNAALCDERLSFRARGVLAFLLAKPDDWEIRTTGLQDYSPKKTQDGDNVTEGRDVMRKALKELKAAGYLSQEPEQYRSDTGKMLWETVTTVRDFPEPESQGPNSVPTPESQGPETSCYVPTSEGASGPWDSGPVVLITNNKTSSREDKETSSLTGVTARVDTPSRPGSKGWDAVRTRSSGPKRKSRRQEALAAAEAERELDPAHIVAEALASGYPGDIPSDPLPASDGDLAPPVRRRRAERSKGPAEKLADYFGREALRVQPSVPGATNKSALASQFAAWKRAGTDYKIINTMIGTYWSDGFARSETQPAWQDFLNVRGLLTNRETKRAKVDEIEANRNNEDYWA
jgi:hypothetical protein